jgi:hypothetical protein
MHQDNSERLEEGIAATKQLQNGYNPQEEMSDVKCYGTVSH